MNVGKTSLITTPVDSDKVLTAPARKRMRSSQECKSAEVAQRYVRLYVVGRNGEESTLKVVRPPSYSKRLRNNTRISIELAAARFFGFSPLVVKNLD